MRVKYPGKWSRYEKREGESGTDERVEARRLFEHVREAGLPVEGGEFIAGPGYRTWRTEADAILSFLLGAGSAHATDQHRDEQAPREPS